MASVNEIIKHQINPFDEVNYRTGNFWVKNQDQKSLVTSIHQESIAEIEQILHLVSADNFSRTVLLTGDSGSGKSYVLGRLKSTLNSKAFFAYIGPWVDDGYIWRHILRYTVDSLIQVPDGQKDSQLILWLESVSNFIKNDLKKKLFNDNVWDLLLSDRQKFVKHLTETYQTYNIYHPETFFGVLHDLTNPKIHTLACEWLRGDNLSEESMQALTVEKCLDTEDAAKKILANFGKISTATQPIVLCFDQVESVPNWLYNPQAIFKLNTTVYNEAIQNFLMIITIATEPWQKIWKQIAPSDKAKIDKLIALKSIDINQAEELWKYVLQRIHKDATPPPESPIAPLNRQILEKCFPGSKTDPKNVLLLGRSQYQKYKSKIIGTSGGGELDPQAEFKLLWQQEYKKVQEKFPKISLLSSPELIRMLQVALEALQVGLVIPKLTSGKYASYSLSYQQVEKAEKIGIIWTEDANMKSLLDVIDTCQRAIQQNLCQKLFLLRMDNLEKLKNNKTYSQIFTQNQHLHIQPNLESVHYLATYNYLVNSAISQELVIGYKTINLQTLQTLTRKCQAFQNCLLLQDLGIVRKSGGDNNSPVKDFLLNLVKTQSFMGLTTLISQVTIEFNDVQESEIQHLIGILCEEKQVKLLNPKAKLEDQLISVISKA
ncbi:ATP-binding protein [Nodularia harveyana UHCC-0300]|uniref:ATP-binding protein n=1 Tax=Nodularia harveyana UHCC-0300 TaxID=2974287 RepID=A0ABU5U8K4_9CYAN|nr:ATP-binding protein [Nodularia harveyana]MEA5579854.1 ATP-binding protein [Nodularia harveyana UHCC-0300]